jgi:hypothetical protein
MGRLQRWDYRGGIYTRRGQPGRIPPGAHNSGLLFRAEVAAQAAVAGRLFRGEMTSTQVQAGRLFRAELIAASQSNITTVPLSSFRQPGDTFETALSRLNADTVVDLEGTTQQFANFDQGGNVYGIYSGFIIGFANGNLQMQAGTSTHASSVNSLPNGATVQETLIRLGRGSSKATTPYLGGVTIQGTSQGHIYNGVVIYYSTNALVENSSFLGVPGSNSAPPGETTPLNNYLSNGTTVRNILMDGQHVTATGMLNSSCTNVLIQDSTFQNTGSGHGVAAYQTRDMTVQNTKFLNIAKAGLGFEKCTGTLTVSGCTFSGNEHDMVVDTDGPSAIVNIIDPIWDGMNSGVKFRVLRHTNYAYPPVANPGPNTQNISDIHMFQNGVEVTSSKLQITTS